MVFDVRTITFPFESSIHAAPMLPSTISSFRLCTSIRLFLQQRGGPKGAASSRKVQDYLRSIAELFVGCVGEN